MSDLWPGNDPNISLQVSSSVSVGESLLYTRDRQAGKADTQDSNWDINDPDIPARIEQYVRILVFTFPPPEHYSWLILTR